MVLGQSHNEKAANANPIGAVTAPAPCRQPPITMQNANTTQIRHSIAKLDAENMTVPGLRLALAVSA